MGPRRRLTAAILLGLGAAAGAWLAAPRRFVVEGVSMGPALLPGDVVRTAVFPALDRLRRPRRFDRWVLAAADGLALKRVVGLPGEEVSIPDGDLAIDGAVVVKGPRVLAETGSVVPEAPGAAAEPADGWWWSQPAGELLDDAEFDTAAPRRLEPVHDSGFTALVDVRAARAAEPATIRCRVGSTESSWPLAGAGRHAVVAGRLDGRAVCVSWRVPGDASTSSARSCVPGGAPERWRVTEPWPRVADDVAPGVAIGPGGDGSTALVAVSRWRDVAYRAGADGRTSWRLGAGEVFVLGDHPPASTDSRRWGPLDVSSLRHRIVARSR